MSGKNFLAFDFGAESGRAILGSLSDKKIRLEEIHRFSNHQIKLFGHIHWDILMLFNELKKGLNASVERKGEGLMGIGVDTWGVDFGLVGRDNQLLGFPFGYRDPRTNDIMEKAFKLMPREEFYSITGIQFMQFNSVFQLLHMKITKHPLLDVAEDLLFMPDLFNFLMTGNKMSEYTICSTSQLLNAKTRQWDEAIFNRLDLPKNLMTPIIQPGTVVGPLLPEILQETGISNVDVIAPACHDTASAVVAVPAKSKYWAYLSSGTWSLLGVETEEPIVTKASLNNNFTNEGGINQRNHFLKNVMGMWLIEECRRCWQRENKPVDYGHLLHLADEARPFKAVVDPDDSTFLHPRDMAAAITEFCLRTNQPAPETQGEFVRTILESLALKYRFTVEKINSMRGVPVDTLHIVGGGSQNEMLNQFTANATGLTVVAGPIEATALGNVIVQAVAKNVLDSIWDGRELVARSFQLKTFEPKDRSQWDDVYNTVDQIFEGKKVTEPH